MPLAQAAQQCCLVEMAFAKSSGGHGDGDTGHDHRQQPRQFEVALRPLQGGAEAGILPLHIKNALPRFQLAFQPLTERLQLVCLAVEKVAVGHPAAGLDHFRGGNIRQVDQRPRLQTEQTAAAIRLVHQHFVDSEGGGPQFHRVTQLQLQRLHNPGFQPDMGLVPGPAVGIRQHLTVCAR